MARFLGGFASASVIWAAFSYAALTGWIDLGLRPPAPDAPDAAVEDAPAAGAERPRHARRSGGKRTKRYAREAMVGDDLGSPGTRALDLEAAGGEQQLRSDEIERQFDAAMPHIRRCLMLAASEEPVTGKIVFGVRISGSAGVTQVNLRGPGAITQSEAGACMQKAARGMQFRKFDGPDMVVHLPMALE